MYVSIEKARRILGYEPRVGLDEGVRRSCQVSFVGTWRGLKANLWVCSILGRRRRNRLGGEAGWDGGWRERR
jgi:hypothetical protein